MGMDLSPRLEKSNLKDSNQIGESAKRQKELQPLQWRWVSGLGLITGIGLMIVRAAIEFLLADFLLESTIFWLTGCGRGIVMLVALHLIVKQCGLRSIIERRVSNLFHPIYW